MYYEVKILNNKKEIRDLVIFDPHNAPIQVICGDEKGTKKLNSQKCYKEDGSYWFEIIKKLPNYKPPVDE